ncbi:hypothetical protein [Phyllobacterium brassicacearum]|nr:hypothetical protein [Phyllobacterium brassicacearum]
MAKQQEEARAMPHAFAMKKSDEFDDSTEYHQACGIVERQFLKLTSLCPGIATAPFMKAGEAMFMWGVFSAMTGSDERSEKLLTTYLHRHAGVDYDLSVEQAHLTASTARMTPLLREISRCGEFAYRENDDELFVHIAQLFLKEMGITSVQ